MGNTYIYLWLAACIVLVVIELGTVALTSVWFAGGALVAFIAALCHASWRWQLALFVIVSLACLFTLRPIVIKYVKPKRTATNVDSLIGKEAMVLAAIDNDREEGTVRLNGQEWTARSETGEKIPADTLVNVTAVRGVKVFVRRKEA